MDGGFREQDFDDQQTGSDNDGAIGYVEGGPLVLADVEEQEVDHAAVKQAIPEVSQGSAENQCQADSGSGHGVAVAPKQGGNDD